MTKTPPVVYLLHGEDDFAIAQFVAELESKLGDAATASMNTTRLDGRTYNPDDLLSVAGAMPFLAKRRLVILTNPLAKLTTKPSQDKFKLQLDKVPPTTAMVLVEYRMLTDERGRRQGKQHWLEEWAEAAGDRALVREFKAPKGPAMARWIQDQAKAAGGQITPPAAALLGTLVGDDPRLAVQEIQKLLAYVNYRRAVEPDDVETLTADSGQADIFAMVDALGGRDGRKALGLLHRLLEQQDAFSIFGMVVRQFRLLLLAREVLDGGGRAADVARALKVPPFVAEKIISQARPFELAELEMVYRRLLELDQAMKTGQMDGPLALDSLVAAFTAA